MSDCGFGFISLFRYTWTYLTYQYLDGHGEMLRSLTKKHGSFSFVNFSFIDSYYFNNLSGELHKVSCPRATLPMGIAIQSGSWDLGFTALRNVVQNPDLIPGFLERVRSFDRNPCANRIKLVLIHTMPYPTCGSNTHCRNARKGKANPAITAIAHLINRALFKVKQWNSQLVVVDAMQIMKSSRLNESFCSNHFLCRHGERQSFKIETTDAGIALASEVMHGLCLGWY